MNPQSLLNAITSATATLTSPQSAPTEIHTASNTLSSLHPPLSTLLQLSATLLSTPSTAPIFHSLLRKQLDPAIYPAHVPSSRAALLDLSTTLLSRPNNHTTFLHAALAVREWPQNWPAFLPTLLPTPSACAVLADLSDAVLVHPGVSPARAEEIVHALALSMPQILPTVVRQLPADDAWRAAEAFMAWVQIDTLFQSTLVDHVLKYLVEGHWGNAIKALEPLVERRVEIAEQEFKTLFKSLLAIVERSEQVVAYLGMCKAPPGGGMPRLKALWPARAGGEVHIFVAKFLQLLSDLGVAHFARCFMYTRRGVVRLSQDDQLVAAGYVDLLLAGLSHPSTMIRLSVLPFFTSLLGAVLKSGHRSPLVAYIAEGYFHAASAALLPVGAVVSEGYDDEKEHETASFNFQARCTSGLSTTAKIEPSIIAQAFERMRGLLARTSTACDGVVVQPTSGHAWIFGKPSPEVYERCLESAAAVADAVAMRVTEEGNETVIKEMQRCFETLLNMTEPSLQIFRAYAVRSFVPLYRMDPNAMDRYIEILGTLIGQGKGRLRTRVCSSFSVIFRRSEGAGLGRYAGSLCEYCLRALGEDFHTVEKIHLVEATLTSVSALQSFEERLMYVERVLLPVLRILAAPEVSRVLTSSASLYEFLDRSTVEQAAPVVGAFSVLETSVHHIVRPISKCTGPIPLPGVLSRHIAPKSVEVTCKLVACLHGMYNGRKFPVETHADQLHPTSRDVAFLLNLELEKGDEQTPQGGKHGSMADRRASQTLLSHGVDPPDPTNAWFRETLRDLRRSAYEILRSAILSGVTRSPTHFNSLVEAISSDFEYIEPLHLLQLISRILHPLVSHSVVTAGPAYLESLANSSIIPLLRCIRQHVDACHKEKTSFSSSATLDIARDHARKAIPRAVADLLAVTYPRRDPPKSDETKDVPEHSPLIFKAGQLGVELSLLWQTVCNPGQSRLDHGAARVGFALVVSAAEMAPKSEFAFFVPLLHGSLRTAVLNASTLVEDSPVQLAISAVLAIIRKWPSESELALRSLEGSNVKNWVREATKEIAKLKAKPKKQRSVLRKLIERLAEVEGTKENKREVQALPRRLVTVNPKRAKGKPKNELDEIVLGDTALDSLFGEGDPL